MALANTENGATWAALAAPYFRQIAGFTFEMRFKKLAIEHKLPILFGVEGASIDFAIFRHGYDELVRRAAGTTIEHFQRYAATDTSAEDWIRIDAKTFSPRFFSKGGYRMPVQGIGQSAKLTQYQKDHPPCAFVVGNTVTPDYIGFMPVEYGRVFTRNGFGIFNMIQFDAIPSTMRPFFFHVSRLAQAVERIRLAAMDKTYVYRVPGTEIPLPAFRPVFETSAAIITIFERPQSAESIAAIDQLRQQLSSLGFDWLLTSPMLGDFGLTGSTSNAPLRRVEHKCDESMHVLYRRGDRMVCANPSIRSTAFNSLRGWEFLMVQRGSRFWFIPRCIFPASFWISNTEVTDDYNKYARFECTFDEPDWIEHIDNILKEFNHPMKSTPIRAKQTQLDILDMAQNGADGLEDSDDEVDDVDDVQDLDGSLVPTPEAATSDAVRQEKWMASQPLPASEATYHFFENERAYWLFYRLLCACAENEWGIPYLLPKFDKRGHFLFVAYAWPPGAKERFFDNLELPVQLYQLAESGRAHFGIFLRFESICGFQGHTNMIRESHEKTSVLRDNFTGDHRFLMVLTSESDHDELGSKVFTDTDGIDTSYHVIPSHCLHFQDHHSLIQLRLGGDKAASRSTINSLLGCRQERDFVVHAEHLHNHLKQCLTLDGNAPLASGALDNGQTFDNRLYRVFVNDYLAEVAHDCLLEAHTATMKQVWFPLQSEEVLTELREKFGLSCM